METKACTRCHVVKEFSEFYKRAENEKRASWCICCTKEFQSWKSKQQGSIENRKEYRKTERYKEVRRKFDLKNAERRRSLSKVSNREKVEKFLWKAAKKRAREKSLEFNIEVSDIVVPEFCPVFGFKLEVGEGKTKHNSPSLDRIDNTMGYTKDNIAVISHRANELKSNLSLEEYRGLFRLYSRLLEVKNGN